MSVWLINVLRGEREPSLHHSQHEGLHLRTGSAALLCPPGRPGYFPAFLWSSGSRLRGGPGECEAEVPRGHVHRQPEILPVLLPPVLLPRYSCRVQRLRDLPLHREPALHTSANLKYYQPNVFHYHSTPWHYRYGRSADLAARERREARLAEIGDISSIPLSKISDVAANVSVAYNDDIWQNDMIFKDQDDCSKMLVCELNTMRRDGKTLTDTETIIADAFGSGTELDVAKLSLSFDIAAVLGREVGYILLRILILHR